MKWIALTKGNEMKSLRNVVLFSCITALSTSLSFAAGSPVKKWAGKLSESDGSIEFLATGHPSALKVVGKGSAPKGSFILDGEKLSGTATFLMTSLDTGIQVRNEHMKTKYLETGKFPEATLKIVKLAVRSGAPSSDFTAKDSPFEGVLTLHGVEKPVAGMADLKRNGDHLDLAVHFGLKISDYGIATPGYAGITMADGVEVTVKDSASLTAMK
jgi:polyisoprenoid-binding protein YceI